MNRLSCIILATAAIATSPSARAQDHGASSAIDDAMVAMEAAINEAANGSESARDESAGSQDQTEGASVWDRGCGDDRGNDRCDADTRNTMLGHYGFEPAERFAERNAALLRAMIVDGYGNDTVAISFVREPGGSPYVDVRAPSKNPDEAQVLRSPVSVEAWNEVWAASGNFDAELASEVASEDKPLRICLHGWVAVVEAVRPGRSHMSRTFRPVGDEIVEESEIVRPPASLERDTENACADGLAIPFAFKMATAARKLLGECSALDIDDFRNSSTLLALCHRLRGDRHAAADAQEAIEKLEKGLRSEGENFHWNFVRLDEEEAARFRKDVEGAAIYFGAPTAQSPTDATVDAELFYTPDEDADLPKEMATMTIQLFSYSNRFDVLSWEISERRPFKMPSGN